MEEPYVESLYTPFFKKFQPALLDIANSDAGRALFQIPEKEKIVKISPNSYHMEMEKGVYRAVMRGYDLYAGIVNGGWKNKDVPGDLPHIMSYIARKSMSMSPYFHLPMASTATLYTAAGDGSIIFWGTGLLSCADWNSLMDATTSSDPIVRTTTVDYTSSNNYAMITQNGGGSSLVARGFWPFDTSSITNLNHVDSATFSLFGFANYSDTDGKSVCLVEQAQVSTSSLTANDYGTVIRNVLLSDTQILLHLNNTAYNDWPMNSTGIGKISLVGYTKLGTIGNVDYSDSCTSGPVCGHSVSSSETAGTSNDPKLVVNYTSNTTTSTSSSTSTTSTSSSTSTTTTSTSTTRTTNSTSTTSTSSSTTSTSSSTTSTSSSTTTTSSSTSSTSSSTTMPFSVSIDNV
jgi:hypothetical protein